ncbi:MULTISPECIES: hypothetical protein [Streptococcus]|nr:hypothetical protein [Streptococcus thoraltensis]MDY4760513.1 bacteriocin [Streptococcus thoraltensis]
MNSKSIISFQEIQLESLSNVNGGANKWNNAATGAVYGAGIGVSLCTAAGMMTAGATLAATAGCAWAGAKIGGSIAFIADNIIK